MSTCCKIHLQKLNDLTIFSKFDLQTNNTSQFQLSWPFIYGTSKWIREEVDVWIALTTKEKVELEYSINFQVNWYSSRTLKTTGSWRWWRTEQTSADVEVKDAKITLEQLDMWFLEQILGAWKVDQYPACCRRGAWPSGKYKRPFVLPDPPRQQMPSDNCGVWRKIVYLASTPCGNQDSLSLTTSLAS